MCQLVLLSFCKVSFPVRESKFLRNAVFKRDYNSPGPLKSLDSAGNGIMVVNIQRGFE